MRYLDENRPRSGTVEDLRSRSHGCGNLFRVRDGRGETRQGSKDVELSRRLMQRIACFVQQRRGDVGPNQQDGSIRLQALQKRHYRKQIAWTGRREYSSNLPRRAEEGVSRKGRRLFMAYDPMLELRRLAERVIDRDVVNAGYAEAGRDSQTQKTLHHGLPARPGCCLRRCGCGWGCGHA